MAELPEVFQNYNADEIDAGFELIPDSWQLAEIYKSDFGPTKNGEGQKLTLWFQIIEGKFQKRKVIDNLNLINANETAAKIAKSSLNKIYAALDLQSATDSEELHGQPLAIKIGTQPGSGRYPARNVIKDYASADKVETSDVEEEIPF